VKATGNARLLIPSTYIEQTFRKRKICSIKDVRELTFPDETFDQVFTSCTFCSVPDPIDGLIELKRVLKPGGELRMSEHTGSQHFPFRQILNLCNPLAELIGPSINRDTIANVKNAGFTIKQVFNIYLDIIKSIYALKPQNNGTSTKV
jgi:ubiquinone/menaquinone biosynthesis C-methylase UbiE